MNNSITKYLVHTNDFSNNSSNDSLNENNIENKIDKLLKKHYITNESWYIKLNLFHLLNIEQNLGNPNFNLSFLKNNGIEFYNELWKIKPDTYDTVMIFDKEVAMPRYSQSFGNPYFYSGKMHEVKPIPEILKPLHDYVNELGFGEFNQVLVNWYVNGHHYIGKHRDNENQFEPESPIVSISFGAERIFRIRAYKPVEKYNSNNNSNNNSKQDINSKNSNNEFYNQNEIILDQPTIHGLLFIMGGKFQKELTHEIPKINGNKGLNTKSRINITFRKFRNVKQN